MKLKLVKFEIDTMKVLEKVVFVVYNCFALNVVCKSLNLCTESINM